MASQGTGASARPIPCHATIAWPSSPLAVRPLPLFLLLFLPLLLFSSTSLTAVTALSVPNEDGLINTNVLREVSFESPSVVRETVGIVVLNSHGTKPAERYLVPVRKSMHDKLGYLRASERKSKTPLDVLRADYDEKEGIQYYEVRLTNPLQPGEKISINVQYAFVRALKASPARTSMFDEPSWIWIGNAYADLAYPTKKVKTVILALASEDGKASVREYSKRPEPVSHERAGHIVYGPYKDIQPMQSEEISVRISSAQPNIRAYSHRREIHISHWGNNLNVLEHYHLHNDAPELDGPFDKVGQQLATMQMKPHNAILGLPVRLPLLAHNLYFVDEIGNVSTSAVHLTPDRLTRFMRLSPRYPLLGGWNYTWWHSYDIPLDSVLRWDPVDGRYSLKVPFFAGILDASVDDFELQIVLPEGATDVSVILPFEVDERSKRSYYTYFDTTGRTMLVFRQRNVVQEWAQQIVVTYRYSLLSTWQKPLVTSGAVFLVFVASMIASRLPIGFSNLPKTVAVKDKAKRE